MNTRILNRDFAHPADGWYMIEAKGKHPNRPAGVIQIIDDAAGASIANRFNAAADADPNFAGMLIDHEHFSHDTTKETVAYGWLMRLENRPDGVYGRVRWTATGQPAVDGGDYRYFSTEYDSGDLQVLNDGKPREVRPLKLDGLTLTNKNNNRAGAKPITNRETNFRRPVAGGAVQPQPNAVSKVNMKSVCTLLGLSPEAAEEAVHGAVLGLKNRVAQFEAELPPLKNRVTALETENAALVDEQIAADLSSRGIKDTKVVNRLVPVLKGLANRADRVAFLADVIPAPAAGAAGPNGAGQRKLHNRETRAPGAGTAATEAPADPAERVKAAEAEVNAFRITNRCTYQTARDQVRRLKPELFAAPETAATETAAA